MKWFLVDYLIMHDYRWLYIVNLFDNLVFQCFSHCIFTIATLPFPPIILGNLLTELSYSPSIDLLTLRKKVGDSSLQHELQKVSSPKGFQYRLSQKLVHTFLSHLS